MVTEQSLRRDVYSNKSLSFRVRFMKSMREAPGIEIHKTTGHVCLFWFLGETPAWT